MDILNKTMVFVNKTLEESKTMNLKQLGMFFGNASMKLAFLYGLLWVLTQFISFGK